MKNVLHVQDAPRQHWVGDGFPVRSLFSYQSHGKLLSPFLLLDFAGPAEFAPASAPRGVGQHPHRGFETVTIVYDGEVAHRDSTGQGGEIGPGDVQWMTAGAGILHEEFHSPAFTAHGGTLRMLQLWVNLPAKDKGAPAGYQAIVQSQIPAVALPGGGQLRVIAGDYQGQQGPAKTFTPMQVWDLRLVAGEKLELELPEGWSTALAIVQGTVLVNGNDVAREAQLVVMAQEGRKLTLEANGDVALLLMSGEPIDEPIVGYGPFVMNSQQEIVQAVNDFNSGKFGSMRA
ncbi:pirin family protein [Comamonas squillarum]|jgi:redox-sensitive bicupin YhaK (pirin superfamily)|uniref:Pirin family protein n=1 Tax=Comamonas squillarum TaxID=2977320 RepID=A0ABY5ZUS5_9BURK|nr:pirin family protein [Comamonas sp. PR12]UXC17666.1 pirin family protein [Comamonas sp. PR12]